MTEIPRLVTVVAPALMFGSFLVEFVISRAVLRDEHHELKDTATNLVIGAVYLVTATLQGTLVLGAFVALWAVSPWRWDMSSPWSWLALFVVEDFLYYWSHRASHRLRALWVSHVVHHNSSKLNLSTGMRNSWVGGYLDWVFFLPLAALGFHPLSVAVVQAAATAWDFLTHTQYVGRNRVLDLIFNSPSNHRVHHGASPECVDKNFGGALIVWDRLFGTYQAENAPVSFGTQPMPSRPYHPIYLQFYLWRQLILDVRRSFAELLRSSKSEETP